MSNTTHKPTHIAYTVRKTESGDFWTHIGAVFAHGKGGGFTVDGACASSLLAVAQACSALEARDLEVALAGGVDLSLDPFELVGFAHTAALAPVEMRVYDRRSSGFWPGAEAAIPRYSR